MASLVVGLLILLPLVWLLLHRRNHGKHNSTLPPGPSSLPIIGNLHMLGQLPHRSLAKLAQKYGPIMSLRLGLIPTIVVSSPQAVELFLKQHDAVLSNRPVLQASIYLSYGTKAIALTPYGDYWRRVRKMCTLHLLSAAKVDGFEGLRREEISAAVERLRMAAEAREVVDLDKKVVELIQEITFNMVLGKRKTEDKSYDLKEAIEEALALAGAFNVADCIPFLAPFDIQGLTRRMKVVSKVIDKTFNSIIKEHLNQDLQQRTDILSTMLALMNNSNDEFLSSFDQENVKAIMLDLFVGSIDTSSVTIIWALSGLLKHPRVMKTLQDELDVIIGRERMVKESDLPKLPYLDMVVKETFRLYPVAPLLVPRESMEDMVINGYKIPKGSRIIINFWAFGRDRKVWSENAEDFYPERFINKNIDIQGQNFELIPFGLGRRGCPGVRLGLLTIKMVLAQLVHCFKWELPEVMQHKEVDMTEKFGLAMPRATKLLAIPSYRLLGHS